MSKKSVVQFFCISLIVLIIITGIIVYKRYLDDYLHQLGELSQNCRCKLSSIQRIENGQIKKIPFIPWAVSISKVGYHLCMGTILNAYFILTAQHCINRTNIESRNLLEVRVGLYELFDSKLKEKTYRVNEIYKFPSFDYSNSLRGGDLCLIKLSTPIKFEKGLVEPACLDLDGRKIVVDNTNFTFNQTDQDNQSNKNKTKERFITSGFGTKSDVIYNREELIGEIKPSPILKIGYFTEVVDLFESDSNLKQLLNMFIFVDPIDKENGQNCRGDSGNSLNYEDENGLTTVRGVASSSIPIRYNETAVQFCKSYSLYSRLTYKNYKQFIESAVSDLRCRADLINFVH